LFGGLALIFGGAASGARGRTASVEPPPAAPVRIAPSVPASEPGKASPTGTILVEPVTVRPARHPLDGLSSAELDRAALGIARGTASAVPESLGTVCVGRPNRGRLFNAVELVSGEGLKVMSHGKHSFGTTETVRALRDAAAEVRRQFPGGPDLLVGDISQARGGYLRPHRSHQLGLDADIGYFYRPSAKWYTKANAENLDRERSWALIKALIAAGNVEYIFMDRSVQLLLREYARSAGEDPLWLETLFETAAKKDTLIRHAWGHSTHFHVRFLDPMAEESGRRLQARLRRAGKI
jgi:penicillin-insensitive murein endopeptidase